MVSLQRIFSALNRPSFDMLVVTEIYAFLESSIVGEVTGQDV